MDVRLLVNLSMWQESRETSKGSRVVRVMWSRCLSDLLLCLFLVQCLLLATGLTCSVCSSVCINKIRCSGHHMAPLHWLIIFNRLCTADVHFVAVITSLLASIIYLSPSVCVYVQRKTTMPVLMTLLGSEWKAPILCNPCPTVFSWPIFIFISFHTNMNTHLLTSKHT